MSNCRDAALVTIVAVAAAVALLVFAVPRLTPTGRWGGLNRSSHTSWSRRRSFVRRQQQAKRALLALAPVRRAGPGDRTFLEAIA